MLADHRRRLARLEQQQQRRQPLRTINPAAIIAAGVTIELAMRRRARAAGGNEAVTFADARMQQVLERVERERAARDARPRRMIGG